MATALDQETLKLEHLPLTRDVPDEFEIKIIRSYREHSGGLPKADLEPQAPPSRQYLSHLQIVAVHFVVVLSSKRTEEVWECMMTPIRTRSKKCLDINNGQFILESILEPSDGITDISVRDWMGNDLPRHAAGIGFVLPADISMQYEVTLKLFSLNGTNKHEVSSALLNVTTFEEKDDLANLQEGKGLECIERPIPKTKPQGVVGTTQGTEIIKHFQNLIDNGERERFMEDKKMVESFVDRAPKFQDLLSAIFMEKSYFYQDERSVETSQKALKQARKHHSTNENIFLCLAKGFKAFLSAKEGFFSNARQHIEEETEICKEMAPGENKAIVCYDWVQYFAEKAASLGVLSEEEREDAERYFNGVIQYHNSDQLMQETENHRLLMRSCVRQLSLYLKTSRRKPPNFDTEVNHTDLGKAEDLLNKIRRKFADDLSTKHHVILFMHETDLLIRKKDFGNALKPCLRGLQLARRLRKDSLIEGMEARLRMLVDIEDTSEEELLRRFEPELTNDVQNLRLDSDSRTQTQIRQLLEKLDAIEDDI